MPLTFNTAPPKPGKPAPYEGELGVVNQYGYGSMRLAPHTYNGTEDVNRVMVLIAEEVG